MSDGDKDALAAVRVVENPLFSLALVALFVASSAYLWRASGAVLAPLQDTDADEPKQSSSDSAADAEKSKGPRTKERRRRGKDPLRDLLKNGKKLKAFSKIHVVTKPASAPDSALPVDDFTPSSLHSDSAGLTHARDDAAVQEPSPAGLAVSGSDTLAPSPPPPDQPCDSPATQSQLSSTSLPSESSSIPTSTQGPAMPTSVCRPSGEEGHLLLHPLSNVISRSPRRAPGADNTVVVNGFHATRHAPIPRRAPTPSSGTNTPPPSVAVQTQLASLRGALEAARQREAQMKSDLERYAKELEFMRWESNTWRRRELELQNQVNYLSHQLQTLAASFSPVPSSAPSVVSSPPLQNATTSSSSRASSSSANTSPTKNGYHVPLPSQTSPQAQPSALHIIPPPSGLFSPVPMIHTPVYYPYPPISGSHSYHHNYSHFSPQNQAHPHSLTMSPTQPASLMSIFSPGTAEPNSGGGNSGPSSAPDSSSSVGSLSPDISNLAVDRGRRRVRSRMHMGGWNGIGAEEENGYSRDGGGYEESSGDDESEVSEVLADAILKRPGTLKLGKSKSRTLRSSPSAEPTPDANGSPDSESQAEFTFPSLSAFGGNVRGDKKPKDSEPVGLQNGNGSIVTTAEASPSSLDDLEKAEQLDTEAQKSAVKESQPSSSELPAG